MMEIFVYSFFKNALIGSLFACIVCGIVGTYVVSRRLVFISGGISHASFGGVGLGMFLNISPSFMAFLFATASALGVQALSRGKEIREDSAIAVFWILGMALGIMFSFLTPGYSGELSTYLFGNILTITTGDIILLAAIALTLSLFTSVFFGAILATSFDRDHAASRNIPTAFIEGTMIVFVALAIVATLRLVGVVMVISLLTVPQMTAMLFTNSYKKIIFASIVIGYTTNVAGLLLSYWWDIPSGATIIICSIAFYSLCIIGKAVYRRCVKASCHPQ